MTEAKADLLKEQGLLTYSAPEPRLIPFTKRDELDHWRAMITPTTPSYSIQRRLARTERTLLVDRVVRWIRRVKP